MSISRSNMKLSEGSVPWRQSRVSASSYVARLRLAGIQNSLISGDGTRPLAFDLTAVTASGHGEECIKQKPDAKAGKDNSRKRRDHRRGGVDTVTNGGKRHRVDDNPDGDPTEQPYE